MYNRHTSLATSRAGRDHGEVGLHICNVWHSGTRCMHGEEILHPSPAQVIFSYSVLCSVSDCDVDGDDRASGPEYNRAS